MSEKVSFRVTTHWKRPRGEPGLTQLASARLSLGEALDWVLCELPENAVTMDGGPEQVTITIDWSQVPAGIRDGTR